MTFYAEVEGREEAMLAVSEFKIGLGEGRHSTGIHFESFRDCLWP